MKEIQIKQHTIYQCNESSPCILLHLVDSEEYKAWQQKELMDTYTHVLILIQNWNQDLSPWKAPAVFGNEDFGDGAKELLHFIEEEVVPYYGIDKTYILCGYSLAGLFALWASYQTTRFVGVVAASPSVWFPNFLTYCKQHPIQTSHVYLSLGNKEEKTRNPVMATVGDCIRELYELLNTNVDCILEWNEGNHFKEPDIRIQKGITWIMKRCA